jgi:hypothetical protein
LFKASKRNIGGDMNDDTQRILADSNRSYFAALAMNGLVQGAGFIKLRRKDREEMCKIAWQIADEMIAAGERKEEE